MAVILNFPEPGQVTAGKQGNALSTFQGEEKSETGEPGASLKNLKIMKGTAASLGVGKDDNSLCNPANDSCFASPHLLCKRLIRVCICYKGTFSGKLGELISLLRPK